MKLKAHGYFTVAVRYSSFRRRGSVLILLLFNSLCMVRLAGLC